MTIIRAMKSFSKIRQTLLSTVYDIVFHMERKINYFSLFFKYSHDIIHLPLASNAIYGVLFIFSFIQGADDKLGQFLNQGI
jgi:hypothetical protein